MSKLQALVGGTGIGLLLLYLVIIVLLFAASIYGIYLAFCASIILGFIVLLTPPSSTVIGLVYIGWGKNLAAMLVAWLSS